MWEAQPISTTVGGTPEIIEDGVNGLLVPPSDPGKLSEAIAFFLDHPEKREEMGQKGTDYVRRNLTWDNTCRKFESLYKKALHLQRNH